MKKTISVILFIVLAVAIVALAMWYNKRSDDAITQAQVAAGVAAEQAQQQIMQNLKITDVTVGTGAVAQNGDSVSMLYTGTLDDGTVFDASSKHGNQPYTFTLGEGDVIKGWDQGVAGMKIGGRRRLVVPAHLGYGERGAGGVIAPGETLIFVVDLLELR